MSLLYEKRLKKGTIVSCNIGMLGGDKKQQPSFKVCARTHITWRPELEGLNTGYCSSTTQDMSKTRPTSGPE